MTRRQRKVKSSDGKQLPCPVVGCKDPGPFKSEQGLSSHMRNRHPEVFSGEMESSVPGDSAQDRQGFEEENEVEDMPMPPQRKVRNYTPPDLDESDITEFRGRLRQVIQRLNDATDEEKHKLLPEREFLQETIKRLNSLDVDPEYFERSKQYFEDAVEGRVKLVLNASQSSSTVSGGNSPLSRNIQLKAARILSHIRDLFQQIHSMEQEQINRLQGEVMVLRDLSQQVSMGSLDEAGLQHIENTINTEIVPVVEAQRSRSGGLRGPGSRSHSTAAGFTEMRIEDMQDEYKMRQLSRLIREEKMAEQQMMTAMGMNKQNDNPQMMMANLGMVPVQRPKMENGQVVMDEKNNPVMEMTWAVPNQSQDLLVTMLPHLLRKDDGGQIQLMVQAMKDNTALMLEQMRQNGNNDDGFTAKDFVLMQQNHTTQLIEAMKTDNGGNAAIEGKLDNLRQENQQNLRTAYELQIGQLNEKVGEMQQYALQSPGTRLAQNKQELEALGILTSAQATVEEKTITEMTALGKEAIGKIDSVANTFAELVQPFAEVVADNMKPRDAPVGPPQLSDVERLKTYQSLMENVNNAVVATAPQGDPAPLPPT